MKHATLDDTCGLSSTLKSTLHELDAPYDFMSKAGLRNVNAKCRSRWKLHFLWAIIIALLCDARAHSIHRRAQNIFCFSFEICSKSCLYLAGRSSKSAVCIVFYRGNGYIMCKYNLIRIPRFWKSAQTFWSDWKVKSQRAPPSHLHILDTRCSATLSQMPSYCQTASIRRIYN